MSSDRVSEKLLSSYKKKKEVDTEKLYIVSLKKKLFFFRINFPFILLH